MTTHSIAFLRLAIIKLLAGAPTGADLVQLSKALKHYDPENRVGRVFQTMREGGDIIESDERGVYVLSPSGRKLSGLSTVKYLTLNATLPPRDYTRVVGVKANQEQRPSPYNPPIEVKPKIELPMRRPEDVRSPRTDIDEPVSVCVGIDTDDAIQTALLNGPLSFSDICKRVDAAPGATRKHIQDMVRAGKLEAWGTTTDRRYQLPAGVAEKLRVSPAQQVAAPSASEPKPVVATKVNDTREQVISILEKNQRPMSIREIYLSGKWVNRGKPMHEPAVYAQLHIAIKEKRVVAVGDRRNRRYVLPAFLPPGAATNAEEPASIMPAPESQPTVSKQAVKRKRVVVALSHVISSLESLRDAIEEAE